MRLFIAEKPSLARAIADELGITKKKDGCIECGDDVVTWCFGHMFEQAGPDEYTSNDVPTNKQGRKIWRVEELPIIPQAWVLNPKEEAMPQLKIIKKLLDKCDTVINAGDPDREGQLLVNELLEFYQIKVPVLRYWAKSVDSIAVKKALASLKNNDDYKGGADAAMARGRSDWLIGMNLSRAYTLRAQRGGTRDLLAVGRVQSPVLSIVTNRDREIEKFKPVPFHTIKAKIKHLNGEFFASWKPSEEQEGLDQDNRLIDSNIASKIVNSLMDENGLIEDFTSKPKKENHPLGFSLSKLMATASKKYGYSADDVLKTAQSLYLPHKLTSYPRSDCPYLPESQLVEVEAVLDAIKATNPLLTGIIDRANVKIKSRIWNDKKVSAHHAIIPTSQKADVKKLSKMEKNIYDLIVLSYVAQFFPVHEFISTDVSIDVNGEKFHTKGRVVTNKGWHSIFSDDEEGESESEKDSEQELPVMKKGDSISCIEAIKKDSKTSPPSRFTEGTLISAMVNIHRFIPDSEHKKILRDGDGIGTEATRASVITELKKRGYLEENGKNIISSELGRSIIDALPEVVKSPILTALNERVLKSIEEGKSTLTSFMEKQEQLVIDQVKKANTGSVVIKGGKVGVEISSIYKCTSCGSGLSRRPLPKKPGSYWWGCSNYPACQQVYPDLKGSPNYNKGRNNKSKEQS